MGTVCEEVRIDAPLASVRDRWPHFIEWVLVGPRRLLCDDLACVDAADSGVVRFTGSDHGSTTVSLELPPDAAFTWTAEADPVEGHDLRAAVRHDLLLFKDYIESGRGPDHRTRQAVDDRTLRGSLGERRGEGFVDSGLPADPSRRA